MDVPQNAILRYSAARRSRNQRSADSLVRESELTTDEHAGKAVRAPKKSSRLAVISGDTDRLQICATRPRWALNTYPTSRRQSQASSAGSTFTGHCRRVDS